MRYYITLYGEKFDIDDLSPEELSVYQRVLQESLSPIPKPRWDEFANFWAECIVRLYTETCDVTETPLYKICQDIEGRLAIEQGFMKPVESEERRKAMFFAASRIFGDKGRILIVFYAAGMENLRIAEDVVASYALILKNSGILSFSYPFRHDPYPYSPLLHEDLSALLATGYIERSSPLSIAPHGVEWVEAETTKHIWLEEVHGNVREHIKRLSGYDRHMLFKMHYAIMAR